MSTLNVDNLKTLSGNGINIYRYFDDVDTIRSTNVNFGEPLEFSIVDRSLKSGCTDPGSVNYDIFADRDDGSCRYELDCNDKYLKGSNILNTVIDINRGYNMISFPYQFSYEGFNLFDLLMSSYTATGDIYSGGFVDNDFVMSFFDDKVFTAVFMNGEWKNVSDDGYDISVLTPGMGIVLNVNRSGKMNWNLE